MADCRCAYPAGGELCLAVCVAISSVLNQYGAALPANEMSAYLGQLTSTIETQLQAMRTGHRAGSAIEPFVDQLSAALQSVCSVAPNKLGKKLVASLIGEIGQAINTALSGTRPVDGCCGFVNAIAEEAYREHVGAACTSVAFTIKPAESDLGWHGVLSKVSGKTTLEDRPAKTDVNLMLSLRLPWRAALDAIPYVLAHECVAHAFRGPYDSTEDTGQGSEFAEGWMDRVAMLILVGALRVGATPPWPWNTLVDLAVAIEVAWTERLNERDPDPTGGLRSRWKVGALGAVNLERSIRAIVCDQSKATAEFLRLSLLLNASDIDPDDRDRMARRVQFQPPAQLEDPVRTWLTNGLPPASLLRRA